jgi:hypothetical protein
VQVAAAAYAVLLQQRLAVVVVVVQYHVVSSFQHGPCQIFYGCPLVKVAPAV